MPKTAENSRLSQDEWLRAALQMLGERQDPGSIRIEALCQSLDVTKGSFYWHFKSRDDLLAQMIDYWSKRYHEQIHTGLGLPPKDNPAAFLQAVIAFWRSDNFSDTDAAMRQWARHDTRAAKAIESADHLILAQFTEMFEGLGLDQSTAQTRAAILLALGVAAPYLSHIDVATAAASALEILLGR